MDNSHPAAIQQVQPAVPLGADDRLHTPGRSPSDRDSRAVSIAPTERTLASGSGAPLDLAKTLRDLIQRYRHLFDFQLGAKRFGGNDENDIKRRELGVAFENLGVVGLGVSAAYQPTFGSMFNPSNWLRGIKTMRHTPTRDILTGFEGVVRPGEMLLVLGKPGSGCSTLLKTLANQRGEYHQVSGEVYYDSFSPREMANMYRGDIIYCPEDDVHFPTLTVDETLRFAAKTRAPHSRAPGQTRKNYIREITDIIETVFGLGHAKNTAVGDNQVRGVSGGEKKRVSIGEALASRAMIGSWDNSTRGLDASTALEFVSALRTSTDTCHTTTIVSLYQAGESLYELFDKVCVIYEGQMVYFGPAKHARQYFIDMGYEPINRQTTSDFLVAVTDPFARKLRDDISGPVPHTATEFAKHFRNSEFGAQNRQDIDSYRAEFTGKAQRASAYMQSVRAEHAKRMRSGSPYTISIAMQARAVMIRRLQILKGSLATQMVGVAVFVIQAIVVGTVFYQLPTSTSAYFSRGGVLFFALLFSSIATMAEIPALFVQRPIVLRHYKAALYHPFIEALAHTLVDLPIAFITIGAFSAILYWLVGLQKTASQYFIFFLFVLMMTLVMKTWFRMLAAAFKTPAPAQTIAGLAILLLVLYTGYAIPKPTMVGGLRWITYINPLRYGFEALIANEFHTIVGECSNLVPQGPGYESVTLANQVCTTVGAQAGQATVSGERFIELSYGYFYSKLWMDFGIVVTFGIGFLAILLVFTEYNTLVPGQSSVTLFKRGTDATVVEEILASSNDEEKAGGATTHEKDDARVAEAQRVADEEIAAQPAMTDIFSWQHVSYDVALSGGKHRKLLDDVSGYVVPGKLTALMGESGAGKTTLLNVLAERQDAGIVTGDRFVNGQKLPFDFRAQTGYVQQLDTHLDTTTVREALLFSAKMRQPASVPLAEKEAYVEHCLKTCGLEEYADAIVGTLGVEHRKRTTIGVELAAKPKLLLFLDEPTSGLDSQSAWSIMIFLRALAKQGTAILCTIHQPSAELFQQFDRILLLKKGGKTVYFGDLGKNATTLIRYFEQNHARRIAPHENPAEYMLEVIGAGATATTTADWHNIWTTSQNCQEEAENLDNLHQEGRQRPAVQATRRSQFATSWGYQLKTLLERNFLSFWRQPTYLIAKLALNIVGGLLIGFTFFQTKNTQQGTQNKLFATFMSTIISSPLGSQIQIPFLEVRSIFEIRERSSRMYSWTALLISLILVEIPWNILGSSLFYVCWYWTVGFATDRAGYTYLMIGVLFPFYYTTFSQAIAAMAPNAEIAALLFSFFFVFVTLFTGTLQPYRSLGWWKWMYRTSPFTYLIEGLLGQSIGKQEIDCSPVEFATLTPPAGQTCGDYMEKFISASGGYLANPNSTSDCQFCSTRTTDEFLGRNFNIFYAHHWRNTGIFVAFIIFNVAAIFALTYLFRIRKGSLFGFIKSRIARRK